MNTLTPTFNGYRVEFAAPAWNHVGSMDAESFMQLRSVLTSLGSERLAAGGMGVVTFATHQGVWTLDYTLDRQTLRVLEIRRARGPALDAAPRSANRQSANVQSANARDDRASE
jgi:hypothetical protein